MTPQHFHGQRRTQPKSSPPTQPAPPQAAEYQFEAEVVPGLELLARAELQRLPQVRLCDDVGQGRIRFRFEGELAALRGLRLAQAVYLSVTHPVPRPRGLLGDAHWRRLLAQIEAARALNRAQPFQSFSVAAAGSDSSVMQRIRGAVSEATRLADGGDKGDLLIRIRPATGAGESGWETLVRLTPRPLATREWRVCNFEGALNATVAHAMGLLTDPQPDDTFLNAACGSGSILIERQAIAPARLLLGVDLDAVVLDCARRNIEASDVKGTACLCIGDIRTLPLPEGSVTAVCADLPFGQRVGSHQDNVAAYPYMLRELARVTAPGAKCVLLTHEIRLMDSLLRQQPFWLLEQSIQINLRGLHPRIYVLRRTR